MESIPPEKLAALKRTISEHLKSLDLYSQIRAYLTEFVKEGGGTKEEAIDALRQKGVVDELIRSLGSSRAAPAVIRPTLSGDRRYLLLRILKGAAFLDQLGTEDEDGDHAGKLLLSVSFQDQRFVSAPVSAAVDPAFNETFLIDLQRQEGGQLHQAAEVKRLALNDDPLHLVVVQIGSDGQRSLAGTTTFQWRKVLLSGALSATVEIWGIGDEARVTKGLLDVRLELLPQSQELLSSDSLQAQLKQERVRDADSLTHFVSYAKAWWGEYLKLRDSHRNRLVKVLAHAENGEQRPVCTFVQPLKAGRLLGSPLEAARFVSLVAFQEQHALTGSRAEVWSSMHTFVVRGHGDREEHALLLCSLLLGFGLDAYVCIGKDARGGHAWVVTRCSKSRAVFWESLTGRRYQQDDGSATQYSPFRTVDCVFNHCRFYANIQADNTAQHVTFDLDNEGHWKSMQEDVIAPLKRGPSVHFRGSSVDAAAEEERLEARLRHLIAAHRKALKLSVAWDENLSFLLMPALVAYEHEAVCGTAPGNDEFQQSIKRVVPVGHTFKGVPQQFEHLCAERMLASMAEDTVCADVLAAQGDQLRLAVRAKVFLYPEDVCSTWVMLAVKFRKL